MRQHKTLLLAVFMMLATVLLASCVWATASGPDWMSRSGTILNSKSLPDGSHVYLDAEDVAKIKAELATPYILIAEPFRYRERLIVLTIPSPLLRLGQLVDIEGYMTTLPSGDRAIENVTIWGYTDQEGNLLTRGGPLCKGPWERTTWDYMVDLTVRSTTGITAARSSSATTSPNEPNTTPAEGPTRYSSISDILTDSNTQTQGVRTQSFYDGIPDVRGLPDGSFVELGCKGIADAGTVTIDSVTYNYFDMIENPPATDEIRCFYSQPVPDTSRVSRISGQIRHLDENTPIIDIDTGPAGYNPQEPGEGQLQTATEGSVAYAWSCPDDMTVSLSGKVVMADRTDLSSNRLYVEEPSRSAGILIVYTGTAEAVRGATVDISGAVETLTSGERWIDAGSDGITIITPGEPIPNVLGLNNRACGGSDFNALTLGADTPNAPGLYNVGLLVKTWGRVTGAYPSEKCFYLDDGSRLNDTNSHGVLGIKVSWDWQAISQENPEIVPPIEGRFVTVTGISSIETDTAENIIRAIRPRKQADIFGVTPPTISITEPPSDTHKLLGALVPVAGTAIGYEGEIANVRVRVDSGSWNDATYDSGTHTWSYTGWNLDVGPHVIEAEATDEVGNTAHISKAVNVAILIDELDYFAGVMRYCPEQ